LLVPAVISLRSLDASGMVNAAALGPVLFFWCSAVALATVVAAIPMGDASVASASLMCSGKGGFTIVGKDTTPAATDTDITSATACGAKCRTKFDVDGNGSPCTGWVWAQDLGSCTFKIGVNPANDQFEVRASSTAGVVTEIERGTAFT